MKKLIALLLALFMVVSMAGCGSDTPDAGTDEGKEVENKLVVYTPNSDGLINAVIPAFEAKTGIEVELITAGTGDCLTRIESEKENPYADVIFGGMSAANFEKHPDLWEAYTTPYDASLPEAYQNWKGYVTRYCLDGSAALLVNLDVFKELNLNPDEFTGYNDLLWPELYGKIAMGDPANSSSAWAELTNMLLVMGNEAYDEAAWTWVESFIANLNGISIDSSSKIYKGVAEGEYAVGVSYEDPCVSLLIDGATNLKLVYPEEGAVWLPTGTAIVKDCKNLDEAKEFIDFLLSDECQQIISKLTIRGTNTTITPTNKFMKPMSEIKVAVEDLEFTAKNKTAWQQKYADLKATIDSKK
jgi:iron(III) transport system substrate-binding protein